MFYLNQYLFYSHTFKCPGVLPVVGGAIGWQEVDMDPSCCLAIKLPLRCVKQCFRWVFITLPLTGAVLWSIRLKGPWHQTERVVSRPNVRLPPRNCTTRRPPPKMYKKNDAGWAELLNFPRPPRATPGLFHLAWGGHTIKGDESKKCFPPDCPEKPLLRRYRVDPKLHTFTVTGMHPPNA